MSEVLDAALKLLLPALAASLVGALLLGRLGGARLLPIAAALAVAAGMLAGNALRGVFPWRVDHERPLTFADWRAGLEASLEVRPMTEGEEAIPPPPTYYWLPWLAALAMAVELALVPAANSGPGWAARAVVALLAGRLFTLPGARGELPWLPWCLGVVILLHWGVAVGLARRWKDGLVPAAQAACFAAAGVVILHAHSARLADAAMLFGMALLGPALAAFVWRGDASVAAAAGVVVLPGLVLMGQQETFSEVPLSSFALAGLAPLALAVALVPALARQVGWMRWVLAALPLVPAAAAVLLAAWAESLPA
ncbi:MAG: hypothetical protein U0797_08665 [Gemmataceae bacterium]